MKSMDVSEALIETLTSRGWCFGDIDQVKATVVIQSALLGETCTVDSIESELTNMDLRSLGGKSLPDASLLRKSSSYLHGPKVLQISSARDVSRSSIDDGLNNSNKRVLRLSLTDGHSEITAVEYSYIPSIPNDVVPGTKVRLENKAAIHNGILCLTSKVVTVLGGVVQSLYEEWQMNQKYSGFSRSSLRLSQENGTGGPPPFEKLQIGEPSDRFAQPHRSSLQTGTSSEFRQGTRHQNLGSKTDHAVNVLKIVPPRMEITEEKPSNSESRPKEAVEFIPVQNKAAAQKLLQKMDSGHQGDRYSRGWRQRGKGKEEETPVYTLAEWEKRKAMAKPLMRQDVSRDEDLAWQLQNQFDLEDHHVERGPPHEAAAKNITMSMFNFERNDQEFHGTGRGRGRGRGRGSGRGRGRSRGR